MPYSAAEYPQNGIPGNLAYIMEDYCDLSYTFCLRTVLWVFQEHDPVHAFSNAAPRYAYAKLSDGKLICPGTCRYDEF
jgi:hypothetical protein